MASNVMPFTGAQQAFNPGAGTMCFWDGSQWLPCDPSCPPSSGCCPPNVMYVPCFPPPCPPVAPPAITQGPIQGVVDGSRAAAGMVGEFVTAIVNVPYTAYPNETRVGISPIVLQPGDWDIYAHFEFTTFVGPVWFTLTPLPTGIYTDCSSSSGGVPPYTGTQTEQIAAIGAVTGGSFSVPTLLPFTVSVNQSTTTTLPAGTAVFQVSGRRRR